MTHTLRLLALTSCLIASTAFAVKPGDQAPDFKGTDSNGKTQSLAQYKGKWVVLEWANRGCPYEQKHYNSGNMEALQKQWTAKGVVWLSILSSAPGQQGYMTPSEENEYLSSKHASPTAAILDPTEHIGRLYEAKTTASTCSSSTPPASSFTWAPSTTSPHPILTPSKARTTTSAKPSNRPCPANPSPPPSPAATAAP